MQLTDKLFESQHCLAAVSCPPFNPRPSGTPLKGGRAGIYGCGIQESAHLNMKTRHCISGCGRVVPSGLCRALHHYGTTTLSPQTPHRGPRPAISYAPWTHFLSSLRVIARNEAIQMNRDQRRPMALTPRKPPQAADGNGTLELLTVPSP